MTGKERPRHLTSEGWAEAEGPAGGAEAVWPGALWMAGGSVWKRVSLNFGELGPAGQELGVQKTFPCLVHSRCTDTQTPSHTGAGEPKELLTLSLSVPAPSGMPATLPPHCPHSCSGTLPPLPGRVPGHRLSLPGERGSDHQSLPPSPTLWWLTMLGALKARLRPPIS